MEIVRDDNRPHTGSGPESELADVLEALRISAVRLMASTDRPPTRLRVEADGTAVELAWPAGDAGDPGVSSGRSYSALRDGVVPLPPRPALHAVTSDAAVAEPSVDAVCAPAVGVFFRAPGPGAKPFVDIGDMVRVGQQLAIVEAMKLMIPVEAGCAGQVTDILVADSVPVEYGERLFVIGPQHAH